MGENLIKKSPTALCANKVKNLLEKHRDAIIASLPNGFDNFNRMTRSVINAISTTPSIAKCTPESIFISTVKSFSMGLEPNGALGEAYLVPFKNEATFMPGYRGLISIARRSGQINEIYAKEVYQNDTFDVEEGTDRKILHKPDYFCNRGDLIGVYAVFVLKDGAYDFEIMSIDDVNKIRSRSQAAKSSYSPWSTDYAEMAKKTVMKRLLKRAPMSIDLATAVNYDNKAAMGERQDDSDVIDIVGGHIEESELEQPLENPETEPSEGGDDIPGL